ncbi:MAG: Aeribacillus phage [Pseudomonadota bacterium]|jgi:hypothetical protein
MALELLSPTWRAADTDNNPYSGAVWYFYASGGLTPLAVYDADGVSLGSSVTADSGGKFPAIYLDATKAYRGIVKNASGSVTLHDIDPLNATSYFTQTGTGAVDRTFLAKAQDAVHVRDFGAVGDNLTDDYTAIVNAANAASSSGACLVFDGSKAYRINQNSITFPAGLNMQTNGCTFSFSKNMTSATAAVNITGPCTIDKFIASVPTGVLRQRGANITGDDVNIGLIKFTSVDQQIQGSNSGDFAVKLREGARFKVGKIVVTNFDRAVIVALTTDSDIGGIDVTSYVRGFYDDTNTNLRVGKSNIKTRSVNASNTAGHNGMLSANGTNNTFEDFTVLNAAEEGIRIAGGPQRNVHLVRPRVKDAQANGIKVLGTDNTAPVAGEYQQALYITNPIVEDCGTAGGSEDRNGILIQRSVGVQISNPIIRKRDNAYSAVYGILVYASEDVLVTNPLIKDAQYSGIYMLTNINGNLADLSRVDVIGGMVTTCGTDGIQVSSTNAMTIRHVNIQGVKSFGNGRCGATIASGTGGAYVSCFLNAHFYQNTETTISADSTAWLLDCYGIETYGTSGTTFASIVAANSSRWSNETNMFVLKAGTWTAAA